MREQPSYDGEKLLHSEDGMKQLLNAADDLLTVKQAAHVLGVDIGTVYTLVRTGRLAPALVVPYGFDIFGNVKKTWKFFRPADLGLEQRAQ